MNWQDSAIRMLNNSLHPIPTEKNEIDWKTDLSPKTDRLAQHICAFSNYEGGGVLVFGVDNNGVHSSINKITADNIITKLAGIAKNNLSFSISIEHDILEYEGSALLFVFIQEQHDKPIRLRGKDSYDSYCRSAGTTVKMSKTQVNAMIARSQGITYEKQVAKEGVRIQEVLELINYKRLFELLGRKIPRDASLIMEILEQYSFCHKNSNKWNITNLGALLLANDIRNFDSLGDRAVIVRKYVGTNNRELSHQIQGQYGYAVGFDGLVRYILNNIPQKEIISAGIRENIPIYPKVAIREFVANALVHQDFGITGMPICVEIFSNKMTITNPGAPLNSVDRLIDMPPYSRNEQMAQTLYLLGICERRGSGIDRAFAAIEEQCLPPVKITKGENYTKVFIYPPKKFADMTKEERIRACYQHACLLNEDNIAMTNQSLRERLSISKNNSAMVSRVIADTLACGFIKQADPDNQSKKYNSYIPFYA